MENTLRTPGNPISVCENPSLAFSPLVASQNHKDSDPRILTRPQSKKNHRSLLRRTPSTFESPQEPQLPKEPLEHTWPNMPQIPLPEPMAPLSALLHIWVKHLDRQRRKLFYPENVKTEGTCFCWRSGLWRRSEVTLLFLL